MPLHRHGRAGCHAETVRYYYESIVLPAGGQRDYGPGFPVDEVRGLLGALNRARRE